MEAGVHEQEPASSKSLPETVPSGPVQGAQSGLDHSTTPHPGFDYERADNAASSALELCAELMLAVS